MDVFKFQYEWYRGRYFWQHLMYLIIKISLY